MKKIISSLIIFFLIVNIVLFTNYSVFSKALSINIEVDGKTVQFSNQTGYPFIDENSRTQVPFRVILESIGARVSWDNDNNSAVAQKNGVVVEVPIGKNYILKNDKKMQNDTYSLVKDGRTFLPIRLVMESFGYKVSWDEYTQTVKIVAVQNTSSTDYTTSVKDFSNKDTSDNNTDLSEIPSYDKADTYVFKDFFATDNYTKYISYNVLGDINSCYGEYSKVYWKSVFNSMNFKNQKIPASMKLWKQQANGALYYIFPNGRILDTDAIYSTLVVYNLEDKDLQQRFFSDSSNPILDLESYIVMTGTKAAKSVVLQNSKNSYETLKANYEKMAESWLRTDVPSNSDEVTNPAVPETPVNTNIPVKISRKCPTCAGQGNMGPCLVCGGRRYKTVTKYGPTYGTGGSGKYTVEELCSACRGEGSKKCNTCHGTGYVDY